MENQSEIKAVYCLGRLANLDRCSELIYESDGEYMYIRMTSGNLLIINPDLDLQRVKCPNCGYTMVWKRAEKFRRTRTKQNGQIVKRFKTSY